ncbi:MAG: GtrA family protein [Burkholderiales bacterium]|uniref:GtrA family protein n=1 Tax=Microcystis sp. M022S1 TaxID=2771110 RepID=UPI00258FAE01|nr:GtrA family protein [Microcystis sp. M022S1]MCA3160096.1 GtrA family protein [Burkholderiales bacterium]MCA2914275.1 GtrA family protein [Microcystis sp. M022S1]MCA3162073.1 GtrA family protein [Burkholderiales bacterium]MCA3165620.1 GtrA family protein [Burkholderiales bacterium]MCA3169852.1 GtrA family protein [Burkholderiales bacterium]
MKYAIFALLAIFANILTQKMISFYWVLGDALIVSMLGGTLVGLLTKFILDKWFIFNFFPQESIENVRAFFYYSVTGVFTTVIFWCSEVLFYWLFENKEMRYVGAILGLALGYYIKFHLDNQFTFSKVKNEKN